MRSLAPSLPRSLSKRACLTALATVLCAVTSFAAQVPPVYDLSDLNLADGDYLHVVAGATVVVDMEGNTPNLGGVFVQGTLVFSTTVTNPELRACWIVVGSTGSTYAEIKIGTSAVPLPDDQTATITLLGTSNLPSSFTYTNPAAPGGISNNAPAHILGAGDEAAINELLMDGGLVVFNKGRIAAFGAEFGTSWSELAATGDENDTSLSVMGSFADLSDWEGKRIALASTDFDPLQAQEFDVGSVSQSGLNPVVLGLDGTNLDNSLNAAHYALHYTAPNQSGSAWTVDEVAEVGLLTRNVVIRAEDWDDPDWVPGTGEHGHVIIMRELNSSAALPTARLSWVQFLNLGVKGKMMRYPLHFHHAGAQDTLTYPSFVTDSSFTHCFNKFLTIHNTQNMEVKRNVGYETIGNGFYLEDGMATGIDLEDNLGMGTRAIEGTELDGEEPVEDFDMSPAVFYYVSADNMISGNHAAGSSDFGFWYNPVHEDPFKVDGTTSYFINNVGHSNAQHGFYQDKLFSETEIPPRAMPWYESTDTPQLQNSQFYKNRRYGVWVRSYGRVFLSGLKVADNRSGFYLASDGIQDVINIATSGVDWRTLSYITLLDSLAIGETDNEGKVDTALDQEVQTGRSLPQRLPWRDWDDRTHDLPWAALTGIDIYDGLIELQNVNFANFLDVADLEYAAGTFEGNNYLSGDADRFSAAFSQVAYDSQYMADPRNRTSGIEFEGVTHWVGFRYPSATVKGANMIKNTILFDEDGSLTDPNLSLGSGYLLPKDEPFLTYGVTNTSIGANGVRFVHVDDADYASLVVEALALVANEPEPVWVKAFHGVPVVTPQVVEWVHDTQTEDEFIFPLNVALDKHYTIQFRDVDDDIVDPPTEITLTVRFAEQANAAPPSVIVAVPWGSTEPTTHTVDGAGMNLAASLDALKGSGTTSNSYWWDSANHVIIVRIFIAWPSGYDDSDVLTTGTKNVCLIRQN